jgi:hypothetical protein
VGDLGPGNTAILDILAKVFGNDFALKWGAAISAPLTEETSKWAGLILLFLLARNHVRSAYDGLLLGAFSGLGFRLFENFHYMINAVAANFGSREVTDVLRIAVARGVTGLWRHWLFSAIAGTGLGYFIGAKNCSMAHRLAVAAGFLLFAMVTHGLMDAVLALSYLALVANLALAIVGIIFAWRFADRRQRTWMAVLLEDEVTAGTVTSAEAEVLAGPRKARQTYLKAIRADKGEQAARHAGWVIDAETYLAAQIAATNNPASPEADAARAELARVRALPAT